MSSPTRPVAPDTTVPAPRQSSDEAPVLVVAARPDATGLAAAQVLADRMGAEATHGGAQGLDAAVRAAAKVIVLDPGGVRARLTRDRAFTAPAAAGARRDLINRLAPYQNRVRWMSRPEQAAA
ncbi:hypothetical protein [Actinomycetospora sp. NBRC 106375]|uniref:hypothetical protein n=1 Tax=Actinomycetospora sp. NBRC 106375 TaxID=3032207 RepID=UPI0025552205|nr:hypothetical protein [Actinomycetospora sp. NBRC 106375]